MYYFALLQVSYEFDLIVNMENCFETFVDNWDDWKNAIIEYSQAYTKILQQILLDLVPGDSGKLIVCSLILGPIAHNSRERILIVVK